MIKHWKTSDFFTDFSKMKAFRWQVFQVTLMIFYLTVVAQSGEIVVKCRTIAPLFEDPATISLFIFFEIEVFAFLGIIAGLWIWLSMKFFLNNIYGNGPQFTFKTSGGYAAVDTITRNNLDVYILVGLFWDISCDIFLLSSLNVA
jgi:hypothetical protein